ncbi:purine/pyrimidine permease [Bacillus velezensis]
MSGLSGGIAPVPISGAVGFIETTKLPSKKPFLLGSVFVMIISMIPLFMNAFASLPSLGRLCGKLRRFLHDGGSCLYRV